MSKFSKTHFILPFLFLIFLAGHISAISICNPSLPHGCPDRSRNVTIIGGGGGGSSAWDYNMSIIGPWAYNMTVAGATGPYDYNHTVIYNNTMGMLIYNYSLVAGASGDYDYNHTIEANKSIWLTYGGNWYNHTLVIFDQQYLKNDSNVNLTNINVSNNIFVTGNITTGSVNDGYGSDSYIFSQPVTGSVGSGIIWANGTNNFAEVQINCSGLGCSYRGFKVRLVNTSNTEKYCNVPAGFITLDDNTHNVLYVDNACAVQKTSIQTYIETSISPGGITDFANVVAYDGETELVNGLGLENKRMIKIRKLLLQSTGQHLSVVDGFNYQTNSWPGFNITAGDNVYLMDIVPVPFHNNSVEYISHNGVGGWQDVDGWGLNVTACDTGVATQTCTSTTKFRRHFIFMIGNNDTGTDESQIHQLLPLENTNYNTVAQCMDITTYPLTYTLPDYYEYSAVMLWAYCGRAVDNSWVANQWIDLRTVKSAGGTAGTSGTNYWTLSDNNLSTLSSGYIVRISNLTITERFRVNALANISGELYVNNGTAVSPWLYNYSTTLSGYVYNHTTIANASAGNYAKAYTDTASTNLQTNITNVNASAVHQMGAESIYGTKSAYGSWYFYNSTYLTSVQNNIVNGSLEVINLDTTQLLVVNTSNPIVKMILNGNFNITGNLNVSGAINVGGVDVGTWLYNQTTEANKSAGAYAKGYTDTASTNLQTNISNYNDSMAVAVRYAYNFSTTISGYVYNHTTIANASAGTYAKGYTDSATANLNSNISGFIKNNSIANLSKLSIGTGLGESILTVFGNVTINSSSTRGSLHIINTSNGEHLFINGTTGKIGIGTTNPTFMFDISSNGNDLTQTSAIMRATTYSSSAAADRSILVLARSKGTATSPSIVTNGDQIGSFQANAYNGAAFYAIAGINFNIGDAAFVSGDRPPGVVTFSTATAAGSNTERLRVDEYGNVGIGEKSITSTLTVNSSSNKGSLRIYNTSGQEHLFVNGTSGKVGIGDTSPNAKLTVAGTVNITGILTVGNTASGGYIDFGQAAANGRIAYAGGVFSFDTNQAGGFIFYSKAANFTKGLMVNNTLRAIGIVNSSGTIYLNNGTDVSQLPWKLNDSNMNLTNLNVTRYLNIYSTTFGQASSASGSIVGIAGQATVSASSAGGVGLRGEGLADSDSGAVGLQAHASGGGVNIGMYACNNSLASGSCSYPGSGTFAEYIKGDSYWSGGKLTLDKIGGVGITLQNSSVDAGQGLRAYGSYTASGWTGAGLELAGSGTNWYITSFNRTAVAYNNLYIRGSSITLSEGTVTVSGQDLAAESNVWGAASYTVALGASGDYVCNDGDFMAGVRTSGGAATDVICKSI